LAETAQDGFADLGRVRPARLSEQQAFRDRTDGDCHNALVDELTKLTSPLRTHMGHATQRGKNRPGIEEIGFGASGHDGQSAFLRSTGPARDRCVNVAQSDLLDETRMIFRDGRRPPR
jgi:hypothetical protein